MRDERLSPPSSPDEMTPAECREHFGTTGDPMSNDIGKAWITVHAAARELEQALDHAAEVDPCESAEHFAQQANIIKVEAKRYAQMSALPADHYNPLA